MLPREAGPNGACPGHGHSHPCTSQAGPVQSILQSSAKASDGPLPPRAILKCPSSPLKSLAQAAPREPHYWSLLSYSTRGSPAGTRSLPTMPSTHAESCKPEGAIALPHHPLPPAISLFTHLILPKDRKMSPFFPEATLVCVPRIPSTPSSSQTLLHPLASRNSGTPMPGQGPQASALQTH